MDDGLFHDAHEVYDIAEDEPVWLGTFPRKAHAENYIKFLQMISVPASKYEARPV